MDPLSLLVGLLLGGLVAYGLLSFRSAEQHRQREVERAHSRAEDEVRQQSVTGLVAPVHEQLRRVQDQLHQLQVDRARSSAELAASVTTVAAGSERLGRETRALVDALRKPQTRGRWGELQLRRVVEHAGMLARCDFDEQASVTTSDGVLRPDLVVRLPGGGTVVVDAKVTLAAYLEAVESDDPQVQVERVAAHARHLRQHVDRLADKAYWRQFPRSPEFVVLFLPGESFLGPALEADPALLEHACARRVHLATPTTLLSLLRAVALTWQQLELSDGAEGVLEAGRDLFAKLSVYGTHVDKLGRSLTSAVTAYNATVGSLERTVLPSARRMADLGLDGVDLPQPHPVEEPVRQVAAPHLVALRETGTG